MPWHKQNVFIYNVILSSVRYVSIEHQSLIDVNKITWLTVSDATSDVRYVEWSVLRQILRRTVDFFFFLLLVLFFVDHVFEDNGR